MGLFRGQTPVGRWSPPVSPPQGGSTAKHKTQVANVDCRDSGQCLYGIPVHFDQGGRGKAEMVSDFIELFDGRPIAQVSAPNCRSEGAAKSGPSRGQLD